MVEGQNNVQPVKPTERMVILDALRGFALMGIALANFPEFSLWTFLSDGEQAMQPSATVLLTWQASACFI